ncbi:MAG: hypothetical protein SCARUB_01333 [Candidatus Scalindua rubra]|uniref:Transcriptional regulator n=1 Tax=Candidatus Scalindua rubra TaxID=1872076 RepID=A0A1E3XD36_9BACT|nr:MAG: hypothetical protein SCARUB_01333 [Candidatus Scalindua rubra]
MTPNEKEALKKFQEVPEASAIAISKKLAVGVDYCQELCMSLVAQGHLKVVEGGRWPFFAVAEKVAKKKAANKK